MVKKVSIGNRPVNDKKVDEWVQQNLPEAEQKIDVKKKRLTLDIPEPLHRAIKRKAADVGVPMVDMIQELLEKYYG